MKTDADGDSGVEALLRAAIRVDDVDPDEFLARLRLSQWEPGDSINERLTVERKLGSGGMGVVYLARDAELNRLVAVKICARRSEAATERMLAEAQAAAAVDDDNVIVIHDVGMTRGLVYISMEHIEGGTFREWLAGAHSSAEVREVLRRAASGLAAAHAQGVVHRDFKPDNLLVSNDGRVRVADFGLARDLSATIEDDGSSETDGTGGTPGYMPPERLRGGNTTPAGDVFAFGVTLHEALAGRRASDPSGVSRRLPRRMRQLARACLDGDPDRRPSMSEIAERLKPQRTGATTIGALALLAGAAVAAWFTTDASQCDDPRIDPPVLSDASRSAVTAALRAGTTSSVLADRVVGRLDAHLDEWVRVEHEACVDHHDTGRIDAALYRAQHGCLLTRAAEIEQVVELLASGDGETVLQAPRLIDGIVSPARCRSDEVRPVPGERNGAVESATAIRSEIARAAADRRANKPKQSLDRLDALAPRVEAAADSRLAAEWLEGLARSQSATGELDEAVATAAERALPAAIEAGDPRRCASIASFLVRSSGTTRDRAAVKRWGAVADAWLRRAGDPAIDRFWLLLRWGRAATDVQDRPTARSLIEEALAMSESMDDATPHMRASVLSRYGVMLAIDRKHAAEGIEALREAVKTAEEAWGAGAPPVYPYETSLAGALMAAEQYEEAEARLANLVERAQAIFGATHRDTLGARTQLARALMERGAFDAATQHLEAVIADGTADKREQIPMLTDAHQALGIICQRGRDIPGALRHLEAMVELTDLLGDDGDYRGGLALLTMTMARLQNHEYEQARSLARGAKQRFLRKLEPDAIEVLRARAAELYAEAGLGNGAAVIDQMTELRAAFGERGTLRKQQTNRVFERAYGMALRQAGRLQESHDTLQTLAAVLEELDEDVDRVTVLFELAVTKDAMPGRPGADATLQQAKALATEIHRDTKLANIERWERTGVWAHL